MPATSVIALLTDFGSVDSYVAEMKAVMLSINAESRFIDITHDVPPGDVRQGAYYLWRSHKFFPSGTIFLAVVDPGVGTDRRILAARCGDYLFIAPDNGLLSMVAGADECTAFDVTDTEYRLVKDGSTFEGRDVMSALAAYLTLGVEVESQGEKVEDIESFDVSPPSVYDNRIAGEVISVDHFGNVVTNISADEIRQLAEDKLPHVTADGKDIGSIHRTYASVPQGDIVAYIGSCGLLEIGINGGNYANSSGITIGSTIEVVRHEH